jgi:outer membrane protein assembly factor BamB
LTVLTGFLPVLADVNSDRGRPVLLLGHVEEQGRLLTRIYALDTAARKVAWTFDTLDTFEVRPLRTRRHVIVPSGRIGILHGVHPQTGRELWKMSVEPFRCMTALDDATFVVGTRTTRVSCYERKGTSAIKRWDVDLPVQAREVWGVGDRLYVPTYRHVVCLSAQTGRRIWEFTPADAECLYARPIGTELVVWDWWRSDVYALDLETGKVRWHKSTTDAPSLLAWSGATLVFTYGGGKSVQAIHRPSGRDEWSLGGLSLQRDLPPVDDLAYHPFLRPVVGPEGVWLVTEDKKLARCSTERGTIQERWSLEDDVIGLAALPQSILVALPGRWKVFDFRGGKKYEIRAPGPLRYLRLID